MSSSQSTLDTLTPSPRAQDLPAFIKEFYDAWACPTSPEELERLLERSMNRPPPKVNDTIFGGQCIPLRLWNTECIRPANFIKNSEGFAELSSVLISPEYKHASYIFADTLVGLGREFVPVKVRPSRNPKGGKLFEPIGIATLLLRFAEGTEFHDIGPFYANFLVLNEWSAEKGVYAIFGKPDIERILGPANLF